MFEESSDSRSISALAQQRRRALLLECLREYDEPVSLPDLADEVAVREYGAELTSITPENVRDIYLSLYHTHIPKLADADILEYDQESDLVTTVEDIDLEPFEAGPGSNS